MKMRIRNTVIQKLLLYLLSYVVSLFQFFLPICCSCCFYRTIFISQIIQKSRRLHRWICHWTYSRRNTIMLLRRDLYLWRNYLNNFKFFNVCFTHCLSDRTCVCHHSRKNDSLLQWWKLFNRNCLAWNACYQFVLYK